MLIPLPFTKTTFPSEPYRGSDPEWREFVKVSRDPALQQRIKRRQTRRQHREEDANLVFRRAGRNRRQISLDCDESHTRCNPDASSQPGKPRRGG